MIRRLSAHLSSAGARCLDDELLTSIAEGTSDGPALERVEAHIDHCAPCRRLLSQVLVASAGRVRATRRPPG